MPAGVSLPSQIEVVLHSVHLATGTSHVPEVLPQEEMEVFCMAVCHSIQREEGRGSLWQHHMGRPAGPSDPNCRARQHTAECCRNCLLPKGAASPVEAACTQRLGHRAPCPRPHGDGSAGPPSSRAPCRPSCGLCPKGLTAQLPTLSHALPSPPLQQELLPFLSPSEIAPWLTPPHLTGHNKLYA